MRKNKNPGTKLLIVNKEEAELLELKTENYSN
jgi:hypothetical protein